MKVLILIYADKDYIIRIGDPEDRTANKDTISLDYWLLSHTFATIRMANDIANDTRSSHPFQDCRERVSDNSS